MHSFIRHFRPKFHIRFVLVLNEIAQRGRLRDGRSISTRGDADTANKGTRHVALIRETCNKGRLSGHCPLPQKPSCNADSSLDQIRVRRDSRLAHEGTEKLEPAYARQRSQLLERYSLIGCGVKAS